MKIFNKIHSKISFSIVFFCLLSVGAVFYFKKNSTNSISLDLLLLIIVGIFLFNFFVYIFFIGIPITNIYKEIRSVLYGNKFKKIDIFRTDEIGVIAHFINQLMSKVEKFSGEIVEGRRIIGEVSTATEIHNSIFPESPPEGIVGIDITARSKSSSEVGGDSYDIIQKGANTFIYLGDVTGHGVGASLIMVMVNTAIRSLIKSDIISPEKILSNTNEMLFEKIKTNHFMSAVFLRWDNQKQKMYYTGAGHETIMVFSEKTMKVDNIKTGGVALKMVKNMGKMLKEKELHFETGDLMVLYTDGITEAKNNKSERYTMERLITVVEKNGIDSSENVFKAITRDFSLFLGSEKPEDDVTVFVIRNIGQYGTKSVIDISSSLIDNLSDGSSSWTWN